MKFIETYQEARKILKQKGVKVAIAVQGRPEIKIFAEKSDFISTISQVAKEQGSEGPLDYDGNANSFMYDGDEKIFYVDGGV